MGSYCNLFIGSKDFSWKGVIPDVTGLIFDCNDYRSAPLETEDDDEDTYCEHRLITDCASAKKRLAGRGILLDLLKRLHFWAFAFDFEEFKNALEYRCESYLEEKLGQRFRPKHLRSLMRRLLRRFHPLNQDEEFGHVLALHQCKGTVKDYHARMEALIATAQQQKDSKSATFDKMTFSRDYLREFVAQDPYNNTENDPFDDRTTAVFDLDVLYEIGMAIFASADNVPIEMEFTEIVEARRPFTGEKIRAFLEDLRGALRTRSAHFVTAFGGLSLPPKSDSVNPNVLVSMGGRTAKERGDLFETFTERLFQQEPGFGVHRKVRQSDQEIDIVVVNRIDDPFWTSLQSPFLLVECRNRRHKVQAKDVRDFEIKLQNSNALARIGIIVSMSGFTKECFTSAVRSCREGYRVLLADRSSIMSRLHNHLSTKEWIEQLLVDQL
jgi:hypothetical protein